MRIKFPFGRSRAPLRPAVEMVFPPLRPGRTLAVIGDVHGMSGVFSALLARLAAEAPEAHVVCVGDLIDRGEHSAAVLQAAFDSREQMTVLMGNHEEMLLRFLDDPQGQGARWLRNGGLQTVASFGVGAVTAASPGPEWVALRDALRARIGEGMESWLRALPRMVRFGNLAIVHAGADPWVSMEAQKPASLTWGHEDFGRRARTDGVWVAHGHTIVPDPVMARGVISVDTGAYAGGGLTAAIVSDDTARFVVEGR